MPGPALYPYNPSMHKWPVTIPLSRDTQHKGLCGKSSSKCHRQIRGINCDSFLYAGNPSQALLYIPMHPHPVPPCGTIWEKFSDSPCLVPHLSSDHFTCLGRVIPVAQHDTVATDLKLPRSVQRHSLPCFWILNFCLEEKKGLVGHQHQTGRME